MDGVEILGINAEQFPIQLLGLVISRIPVQGSGPQEQVALLASQHIVGRVAHLLDGPYAETSRVFASAMNLPHLGVGSFDASRKTCRVEQWRTREVACKLLAHPV